MNTYTIITLVFAATAAVYLLLILPQQEAKKNAAKQAAMIAQKIDAADPTLFSFYGVCDDGREEVVFALCSQGNSGDKYLSDEVVEMARIYGNGRDGKISYRELRRVRQEVDYALSLLPFHVYHCTTNDSWGKFVERRNYYRSKRK